MEATAKIQRKIDKFPLLLGIISIILGGTAINILNWQHKQLDRVEAKVQQQQLVILELQAEMDRLQSDLKQKPETSPSALKNTQVYAIPAIVVRSNPDNRRRLLKL